MKKNIKIWMKLFIVPTLKKLLHTIQMTNDRPIHRLNYQWQASIYFNWTMVGQYDVTFYRHYKKLMNISNGQNTFLWAIWGVGGRLFCCIDGVIGGGACPGTGGGMGRNPSAPNECTDGVRTNSDGGIDSLTGVRMVRRESVGERSFVW